MDAPDPHPSALSLLDPRRRDALVALAQARHQPASDLLNDAVDAYLDTDRRHRAEIVAALAEADAGDFAGEDEVARAFSLR